LDRNFSDNLFCYLYLEEIKRSRKNISSSLCWKSCLSSSNSEKSYTANMFMVSGNSPCQ